MLRHKLFMPVRLALDWLTGFNHSSHSRWASITSIAMTKFLLEVLRSSGPDYECFDLPPLAYHLSVMNHDASPFLFFGKHLRIREIGRFLFLWALLLSAMGAPAAQADWPEFRGPWGNGHVSAIDGSKPLGLPLHWSETNNVKWKTEIPYRGWSTPVVMNGQVWLTTATVDGHDFFAIGVDAESGKILFNEKVFHSDMPESLGNGASMNSYATPSPVIEPGRVYVHFGSFGTACLDTATGKVLWKRDDLPCRHYRGPSSSLVLFENLIILTMDGADLQYHVALDKKTGQTVWKTNRSVAWNDENVPGQMAKDGDLRKAHSTPLIVTAAGKLQMLSGGAKAAYGYDPRTGRELWKVQYPDFSVAPRPLYDHGLAFFVT